MVIADIGAIRQKRPSAYIPRKPSGDGAVACGRVLDSGTTT
jgi:hypothetical protein